jgi:hypothetical protein
MEFMSDLQSQKIDQRLTAPDRDFEIHLMEIAGRLPSEWAGSEQSQRWPEALLTKAIIEQISATAVSELPTFADEFGRLSLNVSGKLLSFLLPDQWQVSLLTRSFF